MTAFLGPSQPQSWLTDRLPGSLLVSRPGSLLPRAEGLLLERPGELITREEIERKLWPDRNVDFHHSLDVVVNRLRTLLGDKGTSPRYIETVPRKGYRFVEPVTTAAPEARPANDPRHWTRRLFAYAAVAMLAAILALAFVRSRYDKFVPSRRSQATPALPAQ